MHLCYAICATVAILTIPCTPCGWDFKEYLKQDIPGMTFLPQFKKSSLCQYGCMRKLSCVAYAWKKGQNKCYILTDKTKLSNLQASNDTDVNVMTRRCPLQQCKPDTCYNGGTCRPATSGYIFIICDCPPGYWGWWCKQALPDRPPLTTVEDIIPLFSTFPSDVHRTDVDLTDETATTGSQTSPWLPLFIALGIVAMVVLPLGAFLVYNQLNKKKGMVGEKRRPSERRKSSEGRRPSERRKSSQGPSEKCDVVEDATE